VVLVVDRLPPEGCVCCERAAGTAIVYKVTPRHDQKAAGFQDQVISGSPEALSCSCSSSNDPKQGRQQHLCRIEVQVPQILLGVFCCLLPQAPTRGNRERFNAAETIMLHSIHSCAAPPGLGFIRALRGVLRSAAHSIGAASA
jgi:hypothetical protein